MMKQRQPFRPASLDVLEGRVVLSSVAGVSAAEVKHDASHVQHEHVQHTHHQHHQHHHKAK